MQNRRTVGPQKRRSTPRRTSARRAAHAHKNMRMPEFRSWKTLMWLILFFPVGLTMMWKSTCRWNSGVKYAVSTVPVLALAFILIWPFGAAPVRGGVNLVGKEKVVEVYGPELPQMMVAGYSKPAQSTVLAANPETEDDTIYVYATDKQTRYHLGNCKYAYASGRRMTLYEANFRGLTPCNLCKAPAYVPEDQAATQSDAAVQTTDINTYSADETISSNPWG